MTSIVQQIQKARRLSRMRLGQESPDFHVIPSTKGADDPVRIALVPLTEAELDKGFALAASLELPDNMMSADVRDRALMRSNLFHAIRDPADMTRQVFNSVDEMMRELEPADLNYLAEMFQALVEETSPSIDGMTTEQLEELKKAFARIDLNVLSGRSWAHLKLFFSTLAADQLLVNSSSLISTLRSTLTSDESDATPTADPS